MIKLTCLGCARATKDGTPSGERPCCFCIRNYSDIEEWKLKGADLPTTWYDGSKPVKLPMDCYHSLDMAEQILRWTLTSKERITKRQLENLIDACLKTIVPGQNLLWQKAINDLASAANYLLLLMRMSEVKKSVD